MGEAGQLGTATAVLAVVKPGFMKAEARDGCTPHGRIPKVRAARVLTGYHLTLAYAMCKDAACSSVKSVGLVNAEFEVAGQRGQTIWAGSAAGGWGQGLATPENFASPAGGATGRRKMDVNAKGRINQADHHLYVVRLEEIKPEHWGYNLLWDRVVDPDTVAEPRSAEFSSQPTRTRKNLKTKQGADPKAI